MTASLLPELQQLLEDGDLGPLVHVDAHDKIALRATCTGLRAFVNNRIESVSWAGGSAFTADALLALQNFPKLRCVDMRVPALDEEAAAILLRGPPAKQPADAASRASSSVWLPNLTELAVVEQGAGTPADAQPDVAAQLAALPQAPCAPCWPHLERLVLQGRGFSAAVALALARAELPRLRSLSMHGCAALGDEGVGALLAAPWLAQLTEVDMGCCGLSGHGAAAVVQALPARLARLAINHEQKHVHADVDLNADDNFPPANDEDDAAYEEEEAYAAALGGARFLDSLESLQLTCKAVPPSVHDALDEADTTWARLTALTVHVSSAGGVPTMLWSNLYRMSALRELTIAFVGADDQPGHVSSEDWEFLGCISMPCLRLVTLQNAQVGHFKPWFWPAHVWPALEELRFVNCTAAAGWQQRAGVHGARMPMSRVWGAVERRAARTWMEGKLKCIEGPVDACPCAP